MINKLKRELELLKEKVGNVQALAASHGLNPQPYSKSDHEAALRRIAGTLDYIYNRNIMNTEPPVKQITEEVLYHFNRGDIQYLNMNSTGDPFISPACVYLMDHVTGIKDFSEIHLHTNGLKFTKRWWDRRAALREKEFGIWQDITWAHYLENVKNLALGMIKLGLKKGDRVRIRNDLVVDKVYKGDCTFYERMKGHRGKTAVLINCLDDDHGRYYNIDLDNKLDCWGRDMFEGMEV